MAKSGIRDEALCLLACPVCHGALVEESTGTIRCADCRRRYPVQDGIAVLIAERALAD